MIGASRVSNALRPNPADCSSRGLHLLSVSDVSEKLIVCANSSSRVVNMDDGRVDSRNARTFNAAV